MHANKAQNPANTAHNPAQKAQIWISALRNLEGCGQTARFNGKWQNIAFDVCSKMADILENWQTRTHNRSCLLVTSFCGSTRTMHKYHQISTLIRATTKEITVTWE